MPTRLDIISRFFTIMSLPLGRYALKIPARNAVMGFYWNPIGSSNLDLSANAIKGTSGQKIMSPSIIVFRENDRKSSCLLEKIIKKRNKSAKSK